VDCIALYTRVKAHSGGRTNTEPVPNRMDVKGGQAADLVMSKRNIISNCIDSFSVSYVQSWRGGRNEERGNVLVAKDT